jgi:hypothetical protein
MSDTGLRELQRRAAGGDPEAQPALSHEHYRTGRVDTGLDLRGPRSLPLSSG